MNLAIFSLVFVSYLLSSFFYGLHFAFRKESLKKIGKVFFLIAFGLHICFTLVRYMEAGYIPITNLFESLSFFALSISAFFFYLSKIHKVESLSLFLLVALSIIVGISFFLLSEIRPLPPVLNSFWLPIHTIFSFLGNAIFFLGFIISLLYLSTERRIKNKRISVFRIEVPSLETLDNLNQICLSLGFPMLTVGIITGSLWAGRAWGSHWNWDPKETWSLITWIVYAIVIHNRLQKGWIGRKTAYMMIIGFLCILFTFLGVNLFIGGQHSYV